MGNFIMCETIYIQRLQSGLDNGVDDKELLDTIVFNVENKESEDNGY